MKKETSKEVFCLQQRVFLIVLDSVGIGNAPDAKQFSDEGANTLRTIQQSKACIIPQLTALGLTAIDGVEGAPINPIAAYGRLQERSNGKDTIIGHWEIAGIVSEQPMPTYPNGFPADLLEQFSKATGKGVLCNLPYSGTAVLDDYGKQHVETGDLIVYTSADSVFQIAAHEAVVPIEKLYEYCEIARGLLVGEHAVGRVIARPFVGTEGAFLRTTRRHDYALLPPRQTMLDQLGQAGYETYGIGKISDIFGGQGVSHSTTTGGNEDGIQRLLQHLDLDFSGLCFVNLVDFDMLYGHRNDIDGYAAALTAFDKALPDIFEKMRPTDWLIITADHGCDPGFKGTDHTRESVPLLVYQKGMTPRNLGTRIGFCDIGATILDLFSLENNTEGQSFLSALQ